MDKILRLRVTLEFGERVKKLCERKGVKFSKLIRDLLQKEFEKEGI